jgi:nucleoside-diphosphate-sugar epimerase
MRVVVTGATGNLGSATVQALAAEPAVTSILALQRRLPEWSVPKVEWQAADIRYDDLAGPFAGADAVVHMAWQVHPMRNFRRSDPTNVIGSGRVFAAAALAGVGALVYPSSIGAYSPGPKRRVDEAWETDGLPGFGYSRQKVQVERLLDAFERNHPDVRAVRFRAPVVLHRGAATGVRRHFAGPFVPTSLLHPRLVPVLPDVPGLRTQVIHGADVAEATRLALLDPGARGAYNLAAEPALDAKVIAARIGARTVPLSAVAARAAYRTTFALHLGASPPEWFDLTLSSPLLDTARARTELGWAPRHSAEDTVLELIDGWRRGSGLPTPVLDPSTSGPLRVREVLTGVGGMDR